MSTNALALSLRLDGFDDAVVSLKRLGAEGKKASEDVDKGTRAASVSIGQFGRAMSSIAAIGAATTGILSLLARNNADLQDTLEKATVVMTLASAALRGLGAAARFLLNPIGLVIAALGAAIAIFLNWDAVSSAVVRAVTATWRTLGDFFSRLIGNLGTLFVGLFETARGLITLDWTQLQRGLEGIAAGAAGVKTQFVDLGTAAVSFAKDTGAAMLSLLDDLLKKTDDTLEKINAGWVAFADAVIAENEMIAKALLTISEQRAAAEQALRDQELPGWVAYADAIIAETERAQLAVVEIGRQRAAEEKALRDQITQGWVESAEIQMAATEEALLQNAGAANIVAERLRGVADRFREIAQASGLTTQEMTSAWSTFSTWFGGQVTSWADISRSTWQAFSSGVGQAVAQAVVFSEDLATSMKNVLQQIAAAVIQMIVKMAVEWVAAKIIMAAASNAEALVSITAAALEGGARVWAWAIEQWGGWGIVIGAALAAAAIAAILALTGQLGEFAGGMEDVPATGSFLLHKGERVLSRRQNLALERFMDEGGGGSPPVVVITFNFHNQIADDVALRAFEKRIVKQLRQRFA